MNLNASYWRPSWPLVVGAVAFLSYFYLSGDRLLSDPDIYWHIEAGRWILAHGTVPTVDPFSHSLTQAPWVSHEWLSEIVFALAYEFAGWAGVVTLSIGVFAAILALLTRFLLRYLEPIHALLFVAIAQGLTTWHFLARPHLFGIALLALWSSKLICASERGECPPYWLLPIMALWANLHGGFTFGLFLIPFFATEAVLVHQAREKRRRTAYVWARFFLMAVVASLLTPHGFGAIAFTLHMLSMNHAHSQILEWQSPNFQRDYVLEILLGLLLILSFGRGLRLPPVRLVLLLVLLHLALRHARNLELLGIVAPMILAAPFARQWIVQEGKPAGLDRFFAALTQRAGIGAVFVVMLLLCLTALGSWHQELFHPAKNITPAAAVQAAKQAGVTGRVFNSFGFGGYLIFVGIPTFIDGRFDMYGDSFFNRYQLVERLLEQGELDRVFEQYQIQWTLLTPHSAAVSLLDRMAGWHRVYADDVAVVHQRNL